MVYRFKDPEGRLDDWTARQPSIEVRTRVLTWLFELIEDPLAPEVTPVPIPMGLPLYTAIVPGTRVAVTFALIKSPPYPEHMASVVLRRIETLA